MHAPSLRFILVSSALASLLAGCAGKMEDSLVSDDEQARQQALQKLARLGDAEKQALIAPLLGKMGLKRDPTTTVVKDFQQDLKKVKQAPTRENMTKSFAKLGENVYEMGKKRGKACDALVVIGAAAAPALGAIVEDPKEWSFARRDAAAALARIGSPARAAVPALRTGLADKDLYVKIHSAAALVYIGEDDADIRDALARGQQVVDAPLKQTAAEALAKLAAKSPGP